MTNTKTCAACRSENLKTRKLHGVATLHSLDSRVEVGGSDLHFTFCADCGEVAGIKVAEPDKIKCRWL